MRINHSVSVTVDSKYERVVVDVTSFIPYISHIYKLEKKSSRFDFEIINDRTIDRDRPFECHCYIGTHSCVQTESKDS